MYKLNQWIALNMHATHLQAIRAKFVPENVVIFAGKNELKSSFCATLSHCFIIHTYSTKTTIHLSVGG